MKRRAFVKYTESGKIVPGSLIITQGGYPDGPAVWNEVPVDLCCTTTTTTAPTTTTSTTAAPTTTSTTATPTTTSTTIG